MRATNAVYIFVLLLVFSGSTGCEKQPDEPPTTVASGLVLEANPEILQQTLAGEDNITLSLAPEIPTVNSDIRCLFHGSSSVQEWRWEVNGEEVEEAIGALLPRSFFSKGDLVTATAASNGVEASASTRVGNSLPRVLVVPFANSDIYRGVDIRVTPEAIDDDGDSVEFRCVWTLNGETLSWVDGPLLAGDQFQKGDIVKLMVFPFDGEDEGPPFKGLEFEIPNAPPVFISSPPESFRAVEYRYQARAEDPDDEEVIYELTEGPDDMTIDSATGLVVWPVPDGVEGEFLVRIEAHDPEGMKAYQEYTLQINIGG